MGNTLNIPLHILQAFLEPKKEQPAPVVVNVDLSPLAQLLERGIKVKDSVRPLPG